MRKGQNTAATDKNTLLMYSQEAKNLFTKEEQTFFEKASKGEIISPKYLEIQKNMVIEDTKNLFLENPELSPKIAVISIIKTLPDWLPIENLEIVIDYVLKTWKECLRE